MVAGLGFFGSACAFTPPVRGLHAGMPDRVGAGQLEVGGALGAGLFGAGAEAWPSAGVVHVAYGVSARLLVEGGANVEAHWATGWAGVRVRRSWAFPDDVSLSADAELGAGAGAGGSRDRLPPMRWVAPVAGVYEGFGVGVRKGWLGAFARVRFDASSGPGVPATMWPSFAVGLEARLAGRVVLGVSSGAAAMWNPSLAAPAGFWFYQGHAGVLFDVR